MPAVVFGDFSSAASENLEAAIAADSDQVTSPRAVADFLHRLVIVVSRYCDDLAPCDEVEASGRHDLDAWGRAAIDTGAALRTAASFLSRAASQVASAQTEAITSSQAQHLASASSQLAAGRDLLHTHFANSPEGLVREASEWAPVVTSAPVARALMSSITRWSQQLALLTAWLARSVAFDAPPHGDGQPARASARAELASASQWLRVASTAALSALDADPVLAADAELLSGIPVAMAPPRQRPGPSGEAVTKLCHGITISAYRLRAAMHASKDRSPWSPSATSGGWQWMAQAAAVTSHLSELALRTLGTRAGQLTGSPVSQAQLGNAADAMAAMRTAWSQVDRMWDDVVTESRMLPSPAMTDASDLVLRTGRLVWDDPHWTPARSRRAPPRSPTALASEPAMVNVVIAALHQSVDALARVAEADLAGVEAAGHVGRLYVPTRSLAECYDVPRPFAPAPAIRCRELSEAYQLARHASAEAVSALEGLSVASGASSKTLAFARAATTAQFSWPSRQGRQEEGAPGGPGPSERPVTHGRTPAGQPGPVEQAIRDRRVFDPIILLRAAAIDNAARQLITQAENAMPAYGHSPSRTGGSQRAAVNAAQLAAQSFPHDQPSSPSAGQSSRPAGEALSSGRRGTRRFR